MATKYKVIRGGRASEPVDIGETVFRFGLNDYGVASDDSRANKIKYISVSKTEDEYPFFTIPLADLKEVK